MQSPKTVVACALERKMDPCCTPAAQKEDSVPAAQRRPPTRRPKEPRGLHHKTGSSSSQTDEQSIGWGIHQRSKQKSHLEKVIRMTAATDQHKQVDDRLSLRNVHSWLTDRARYIGVQVSERHRRGANSKTGSRATVVAEHYRAPVPGGCSDTRAVF